MQPSLVLGLTVGSYEAYCLDQAVWYLGATISNHLENVGRKKEQGEESARMARERALKIILGGEEAKGAFADPSALFS